MARFNPNGHERIRPSRVEIHKKKGKEKPIMSTRVQTRRSGRKAAVAIVAFIVAISALASQASVHAQVMPPTNPSEAADYWGAVFADGTPLTSGSAVTTPNNWGFTTTVFTNFASGQSLKVEQVTENGYRFSGGLDLHTVIGIVDSSPDQHARIYLWQGSITHVPMGNESCHYSRDLVLGQAQGWFFSVTVYVSDFPVGDGSSTQPPFVTQTTAGWYTFPTCGAASAVPVQVTTVSQPTTVSTTSTAGCPGVYKAENGQQGCNISVVNCPTNPAAAAARWGGRAQDWPITYAPNGWFFHSFDGSAQTITLQPGDIGDNGTQFGAPWSNSVKELMIYCRNVPAV